MTATVLPIFRTPVPRHTLTVLGEIYAVATDAAERLDHDIAEAVAELADANDWRQGILLVRLQSMRNEQARQIELAGRSLRQLDELRQRHGMGPSVAAMVFAESQRG